MYEYDNDAEDDNDCSLLLLLLLHDDDDDDDDYYYYYYYYCCYDGSGNDTITHWRRNSRSENHCDENGASRKGHARQPSRYL